MDLLGMFFLALIVAPVIVLLIIVVQCMGDAKGSRRTRAAQRKADRILWDAEMRINNNNK